MTEANTKSNEIDLQPIEDEHTTNFLDDGQIQIEHVNFEFAQVSQLQGISRKLMVFNDTHCYQTIKDKHQRKYKYRIHLACLDTRLFRVRTVKWNWLYASLALWLLDTLLVYMALTKTPSMIFLGLSVATTTTALLTLLAFFYYFRDTVIFRSQYGKVKLLEVINKNPDRDSFRSFISTFVAQINKSKADTGFNQNQFLVRELQELRRLKDETVISEASYEKAKRLIFKHEAFNAAE